MKPQAYIKLPLYFDTMEWNIFLKSIFDWIDFWMHHLTKIFHCCLKSYDVLLHQTGLKRCVSWWNSFEKFCKVKIVSPGHVQNILKIPSVVTLESSGSSSIGSRIMRKGSGLKKRSRRRTKCVKAVARARQQREQMCLRLRDMSWCCCWIALLLL